MRKAVGYMIWFGMVSISAAEIVAWKVQLGQYSYQPGKDLERPPEASPFFGPGDELRDAGKPHAINAPTVEWAVWNETTGTLVTKSSMEQVGPLRHLLAPENVPRQGRIRVQLFDTAEEHLPASGAQPACTLEWLTRSGRKSSAVQEADGKRMEVKSELTLGETGETAHVLLEGTFQLPGQEKLKIKSGFTLRSGSSLWVAGDHSNGKGMEVKVTATTVLMDGSPLADLIRIQKDGKAVALEQTSHSFERHRIGGKAWLILGSADIMDFLPGESDDEIDPFAEPGTVVRKSDRFEKLKVAKVPGPIAEWFQGPVLDIREIMTGMGIVVTEGVDFAGYDVLKKTVVFFTPSDPEADKVEALLTPGCNLRPKSVSVSIEGTGRIHVMSHTMTSAHVTRGADDEKPVRSFHLEPTIGDSGLDLSFIYQDESSGKSAVLLETAVTVEDDRPLEILGDGSEVPLKIKGTIVEQ